MLELQHLAGAEVAGSWQVPSPRLFALVRFEPLQACTADCGHAAGLELLTRLHWCSPIQQHEQCIGM